MYVLENFSVDGALITNSSPPYRSVHSVKTIEEGEAIVLSLNIEDALVRLAKYRYDFEVSGLDVEGGSRVKTDRESQAQVSSAFVSLNFDLIPDTDFKAVDGWGKITKEQITPIAKAVAAHTRACFTSERAVQGLIEEAGSTAAILAIDIPAAFKNAYRAAYDEVMKPAGA